MNEYNSKFTGPEIDAALSRAAAGGTIDQDLALKAPLASPALTGTPTINGIPAATVQSFPNPNLLDNWYFPNPVDQRGGYVVPPGVDYYLPGASEPSGQTDKYYRAERFEGGSVLWTVDGVEWHTFDSSAVRGYTGAGYGPDRWHLLGDTASVIINNDSITLNGGTSGAWWNQYLDNQDKYIGRTVTFSVLYTGNNFQTVTGVLTSNEMLILTNAPNGWDTIGVENGKLRLQISCNANLSKSPIAVKIGLGSTQTLAHQDADGNWVLNEIPDYAAELAKCQYYYREGYINAWLQRARETDSPKYSMTVNFPKMRTAPAVTLYDGSGNIITSQPSLAVSYPESFTVVSDVETVLYRYALNSEL